MHAYASILCSLTMEPTRTTYALQAEKINAIFPMRFRDDTDLAIATSFFQVCLHAFASHPRIRHAAADEPFVVVAGAAGGRELVREGAQVQLVADPTAGAARGERAPPHHQRRIRLLRYVQHRKKKNLVS
jgi:hypothetical protein